MTALTGPCSTGHLASVEPHKPSVEDVAEHPEHRLTRSSPPATQVMLLAAVCIGRMCKRRIVEDVTGKAR